MGLVARVLEKAGIPTVVLTNMPWVSEKIGVPRAAAVEFPFGMIYGHPGEREMQLAILRAMLDLAETADTAGTMVELPYEWPEEDFKKRDWFPEEPTPWLASEEGVKMMLEFLAHGNPLE